MIKRCNNIWKQITEASGYVLNNFKRRGQDREKALCIIYINIVICYTNTSQIALMRNGRHRKQNSSNLSLIPEQNMQLENSYGQIGMNQQQFQSNMYNKIKSFIIKSNNRKSAMKLPKKQNRSSSIKSVRVLVRSEQQKELMQYLGPRVLPVLVQSPQLKQQDQTKSKKIKSKSVLDNILYDRQKFMRTYFADLKQHRKSGNQQQISYVFPEIRMGAWVIAGYIKGKYVLVKADHKKGKSVIKKYLYSQSYKAIRKNYEGWVKDHFVSEIQPI